MRETRNILEVTYPNPKRWYHRFFKIDPGTTAVIEDFARGSSFISTFKFNPETQWYESQYDSQRGALLKILQEIGFTPEESQTCVDEANNDLGVINEQIRIHKFAQYHYKEKQ